MSTPAIDRVADAATAVRKPQSVSFYSLGRASIFTVSREGDDFFGQVSGQRKLRLAAAGDGADAPVVVSANPGCLPAIPVNQPVTGR